VWRPATSAAAHAFAKRRCCRLQQGAALGWPVSPTLAQIIPVWPSSDRGRSHSQFVSLSVGAVGLVLLGSAAANTEPRGQGVRCEEPFTVDGLATIRFTTYNVLAPLLSSPSQFPTCLPADTLQENRLPRILHRLNSEVKARAVVALQEVDLRWAGKLHTFFAENGYCAVFAQYGKPFNGYMGVMLAWPRTDYEVLDVDISRISDTAPKSMWPTSKAKSQSPFAGMSRSAIEELLGCPPPDFGDTGIPFEWKVARDRMNEAVMVRLRPRKAPQQSFCVATYHMPCLFGSPEKVRVVNVHTYLLLKKLHDFAGSDPAVLMGDFNFKPGDSPYYLATSGGSLDAASAAQPDGPAEVFGLAERLGNNVLMPGGLASAYKTFHGKEPLFTNLAQHKGSSEFMGALDYIWFTPGQLTVIGCPPLPKSRSDVMGPFPTKSEPSDHMLLTATLKLNQPRGG